MHHFRLRLRVSFIRGFCIHPCGIVLQEECSESFVIRRATVANTLLNNLLLLGLLLLLLLTSLHLVERNHVLCAYCGSKCDERSHRQKSELFHNVVVFEINK